ncbi:uncharacterized protein LOC132747344 isoform X2 [Ruditapes philippinarum]|uniref:uncharacterized protein LOC132747344 isoform X2 n=1 Tax=Ruditapes philippinarum TaxID=129788 RepID=UPI00295B878A|nr:uncharacterized protein LOC132747344 isoform X2 [Ruditapes philippinarum]
MPVMRSKYSVLKKFSTKKLYRMCMVASWIIVVFALLHNLSLATMYTITSKLNIRSFRNTAERDHFYHVTSNSGVQNKDTFVSLIENNIHIYSAIAYNSTVGAGVETIYLSGWENRMWSKFYNPEITCCLIYAPNENDIMKTNLSEKHNWYYVGKSKLEVKQYICPNFLRGLNRVPKAVSLGMDKNCPKNKSKYLIVDYPKKEEPDTVAVCAKLVYENISASAIIEWFEYQKMIGVSKVMLYTHNLNANAMSVVKYYKSSGFCEAFPFKNPQIGDQERGVGIKNFQGWNDEQVPVYDCQAKLSGHTYIALYDVDEFLHQNETSSLPKFLKKLSGLYPTAAGFTFKTEIYATTWGRDNGSSSIRDLMIGSYTMRTEAYRDRVKSIVIANRIEPGRLFTHGYWAKRPYKKPVISENLATLKHYRTCRKEWLRKGGEKCFKTIEKTRDTSMLPVAAKLKDRVNEVKNNLGIT